jgi:hypothetical protein
MANYSAVIVSTALAESKEKKTPCVRLLVNTVKCLDTDQEEKRQFYADLWLGEKAVDRTMKTLREIGWDGMSFYDLNMENTLVGTEIEISTAIEEWNGQSFERVKFVNKKGSYENRGLKPCGDDVARMIAHKYDSVLRGGKVTRSKPNPPPGPAYGTADNPVDDLPF